MTGKQKQVLTGAVAAPLLVVLGMYVWRTSVGAGPTNVNTYFSDDDGATYFADEGGKCVELQRRPKPAYVAVVCACEGGKPFVAYLKRQALDQLDAVAKLQSQKDQLFASTPLTDSRRLKIEMELANQQQAAAKEGEIKLPGASNPWVKASTPAGRDLMTKIKCPDGCMGTPQILIP